MPQNFQGDFVGKPVHECRKYSVEGTGDGTNSYGTTEACLGDPLASGVLESMKQIFTENAQLRAQLRTANTQNVVLKGVVAKNTDMESQYHGLLDGYQVSLEAGSALQAIAEEADARLCMQVIQTEEG